MFFLLESVSSYQVWSYLHQVKIWFEFEVNILHNTHTYVIQWNYKTINYYDYLNHERYIRIFDTIYRPAIALLLLKSPSTLEKSKLSQTSDTIDSATAFNPTKVCCKEAINWTVCARRQLVKKIEALNRQIAAQPWNDVPVPFDELLFTQSLWTHIIDAPSARVIRNPLGNACL